MSAIVDAPNPSNAFHQEQVAALLRSYRHWTGRDLLTHEPSPIETAQRLFAAPFVVVSHGTGDDPVFNYGNAIALELFEMSWSEFTSMPSRQSAESINRKQRAEILKQVAEQGYCEQYAGVRISASGRRFQMKNAILWNLLDVQGRYYGQAACFGDWKYI